MSPHNEIMTPASEADVQGMATIHAMRMMTDAQSRLALSVEKVAQTVQRVSEDVAVLKSQDVRAEIALAMAATTELRRDWTNDCKERDTRIVELLQESLDDRRKLWVAVTSLDGKLATLTARVIPLITVGSLIMAAIVAYIMDKVLS